MWFTIARKFVGRRRMSLAADVTLTEAYRAVFLSNQASLADRQAVLADITRDAGYSQVSPPSITSRELWFNEGKRAVAASILSKLQLSDADMTALRNAVRLEVATIQQFGSEDDQ